MESWGVKTKKGGTELHVFGPLNRTKYFSAFFGGKAIVQDTFSVFIPLSQEILAFFRKSKMRLTAFPRSAQKNEKKIEQKVQNFN